MFFLTEAIGGNLFKFRTTSEYEMNRVIIGQHHLTEIAKIQKKKLLILVFSF